MADALSPVETLRAAADRVWTAPNPHPWAAVDPDAARALAGMFERIAWAVDLDKHLIGRVGYEEALQVAQVLLGVPDGPH